MSAACPDPPLSSPATSGLLPGASAGVVMTSETAGATVAPGAGCSCPQQDGRVYHQKGACTDPVAARFGWYASASPPATATPGQADTLTISESTAERDQLAAKLAHALAANQRWAETLADVQQRHTEVKRERDEAREQLDRASKGLDAFDRLLVSYTRSMYAAHIDATGGDHAAASAILREALDGFDGEQWNGTETGIEWLERTRDGG